MPRGEEPEPMPRSAASRPRAGVLGVVSEDGFESFVRDDDEAFVADEPVRGELVRGDEGHELDDDDEGDPDVDRDYTELGAEAQEALRDELQARLGAHLVRGRPRVIVTDNIRTMLSIKRGHGVYTFRLHHMFVDAPPLVLKAIAHYAEQQDREAAELLRAFIDANDEAIRARTQPRPFTIDTQGRWHNLQDIFDELNEHYFEGRIVARITWGSRTRRKRGRQSIKLGSYTVEDQLIRIHPVLDAEDVPRYFVAWVVYHEMLHEIHDMPIVDGRRVYHTREFRRAEAQFDQYAEAVLWERTNLHRLLDR